MSLVASPAVSRLNAFLPIPVVPDGCQQPCSAGEPVTGQHRTALGPAPAVVFEAAGADQAAAAVLQLLAHFKDNAEKAKWLIQPECSLGVTAPGSGFAGKDAGLSEAEGAGRELPPCCVCEPRACVPCAMAAGISWRPQTGPEKSSGCK